MARCFAPGKATFLAVEMKKRTKLGIVIRHMFSKKALGYRAFTVTWTMCAVMFWNYIYFQEIVFFESLEVTLTIVIGKFLFYGIWEFFHLKEIDLEAVYDIEDHQRIDQIIAIKDLDGRYIDPDIDDFHLPRL